MISLSVDLPSVFTHSPNFSIPSNRTFQLLSANIEIKFEGIASFDSTWDSADSCVNLYRKGSEGFPADEEEGGGGADLVVGGFFVAVEGGADEVVEEGGGGFFVAKRAGGARTTGGLGDEGGTSSNSEVLGGGCDFGCNLAASAAGNFGLGLTPT